MGRGQEKLPDGKYTPAYPDHLFKTATASPTGFSITPPSNVFCAHILSEVYCLTSLPLGCKLLAGMGLFLCPSVYPQHLEQYQAQIQ